MEVFRLLPVGVDQGLPGTQGMTQRRNGMEKNIQILRVVLQDRGDPSTVLRTGLVSIRQAQDRTGLAAGLTSNSYTHTQLQTNNQTVVTNHVYNRTSVLDLSRGGMA